jgi:hypothetical protein
MNRSRLRRRWRLLRFPVAIGDKGARFKIGATGAMEVELLRQPLKPFPAFLRPGALAFIEHKRLKLALGDTGHAANEIIGDG